MKKMTKEEFKQKYSKKSGTTVRNFDKNFVVMKCTCNISDCPGWMVVNNDKDSVKRHKRLYGVGD